MRRFWRTYSRSPSCRGRWYADLAEILTTAVVGSIFVVLAPIVGAMTMLALGLFTAAAMAAGAWYFFSQQGLLFDLTFPLIAIFATFATLLFINYFREQADRRRIRGAFSQYISPTLVEQLANSPKKLVLGGEVRNMTILFSDVRGFTTISETFKDNPQGLTQLMNRLLTPLTNSIIERKGTIDKYIGDAIMAFWNAPLDDGDHEAHACAAALDMLRRIDDLNHEREAEALEDGVAVLPDEDRARHQYRHLRGRQYGFGSALRLFGAGRSGEPRLAAGRPLQGIRHADHHRRQDRREGQRHFRRPCRST